jgi:1,4-alpha-glucan branching enzyme
MSGDGWRLLQDCTGTARYRDPSAIQIAEYWGVNPHVVRPTAEGGAGFDATWNDRLRESVRAAVEAAARGRDAQVDLHAVAAALDAADFPARWKAVNCIESHDEVYHGRESRIARIADGNNPRSWYARSRSRVATGLLLTAPGIPMLFMGQEILEHRPWSDNPGYHAETLIDWDALQHDGAARDHLRFTRELVRLRLRHPALRGDGFRLIGVDPANRVLAFQRWVEGVGRDVAVVASLNESTLYDYRLGLPRAGFWHEAFNSDVYDGWVNPQVAGNGGGVHAAAEPRHQLPASAALVVPANSILVLTSDNGDP